MSRVILKETVRTDEDESYDWKEDVQKSLSESQLLRSVYFYRPGEIDEHAIVLTVHRVHPDDYQALAEGTADYITKIVVN